MNSLDPPSIIDACIKNTTIDLVKANASNKDDNTSLRSGNSRSSRAEK
jgi:hypothetical protein